MSRAGDGATDPKGPPLEPAATDPSVALGTILAVAAHELSNPMTGILAFARYAVERTDPTDRLHELLIDIEREALRCTSTIQDLLAFSRVSGLEEHAIASLPEVVERAVEVLSALAVQRGIAIACDFDPAAPPVRVQPGSLHQALVNLLASAIDALIAAGGYDPELGARPMRRTVSRLIEAPLARAILRGELPRACTVVVRGAGDQIVLARTRETPVAAE